MPFCTHSLALLHGCQLRRAPWADQHLIAPETARVTTNLGSHVNVRSGDSGGHCIRSKSWEPEEIGPNLLRSTSWQKQYNRPGYNEYALASCAINKCRFEPHI